MDKKIIMNHHSHVNTVQKCSPNEFKRSLGSLIWHVLQLSGVDSIKIHREDSDLWI